MEGGALVLVLAQSRLRFSQLIFSLVLVSQADGQEAGGCSGSSKEPGGRERDSFLAAVSSCFLSSDRTLVFHVLHMSVAYTPETRPPVPI